MPGHEKVSNLIKRQVAWLQIDLALALGGDRNSYYCGDTDDPAALADLEVGGVEPQIWPVADQRALEESVHALVDVLAKSPSPLFAISSASGNLASLIGTN